MKPIKNIRNEWFKNTQVLSLGFLHLALSFIYKIEWKQIKYFYKHENKYKKSKRVVNFDFFLLFYLMQRYEELNKVGEGKW